MNTDELLVERGKTHGEYSDHARCTQNIMRAMQSEKNWDSLSDMQKESLHMFAHKMGRIATGNPDIHDHWDDIAGYAKLVSDRIPKTVADVKVVPEDTDMKSFSAGRTKDIVAEVMSKKFPRRATHAEYLTLKTTFVTEGPAKGARVASLYSQEPDPSGRYVMTDVFAEVYGG